MFDPIPMPGRLISEMYIFSRAYPLGRPRMRKDASGVYQPLENQADMRDQLHDYYLEEPITRPLCLSARIFYQKPYYAPLEDVSRYDVDNLTKAICDNLQHCNIIKDDRLILRTDVTKAYGAEDYLIIRLYEVEYEIEDIPGTSPQWDPEFD